MPPERKHGPAAYSYTNHAVAPATDLKGRKFAAQQSMNVVAYRRGYGGAVSAGASQVCGDTVRTDAPAAHTVTTRTGMTDGAGRFAPVTIVGPASTTYL